jgi:L,D-peptidoglycan transpeptidase YkuD (ErfK/YbiS/YcfS/YnhG family)
MSMASKLSGFLLALALPACSSLPHAAASVDAPDVVAADQLVLVLTADWDATTGRLRRFERVHGQWRATGEPFDISVGRTGLAWGLGLHETQAGLQKREGDGRAPAGRFAIGPAFGYAATDPTALAYLPMTATSYCMDVSGSPLYNRIVDAQVVGAKAVEGSSEPMRLDLYGNGDARYEIGFVIEHNAQARAGAGSCIFAHVWKAPGASTAGCTAMTKDHMRGLLDWLQPQRHPVFVQLPEAEYRRLRDRWQLPAIDV